MQGFLDRSGIVRGNFPAWSERYSGILGGRATAAHRCLVIPTAQISDMSARTVPPVITVGRLVQTCQNFGRLALCNIGSVDAQSDPPGMTRWRRWLIFRQ